MVGWLILFIWLAICLAGSAAPAVSGASREYQLKAVFLFNFAQFTEWPADAFAKPDSPLIIGVLGNDPFGGILAETVKGEAVHGHPLEVHHFRTVEEIKTCHILYISRSEDTRLERIVAAFKGKPILTVSDIDRAAYRGAMVRFLMEQNKIRLRINLEAVKSANLNMSSKVLRAAQIVGREDD